MIMLMLLLLVMVPLAVAVIIFITIDIIIMLMAMPFLLRILVTHVTSSSYSLLQRSVAHFTSLSLIIIHHHHRHHLEPGQKRALNKHHNRKGVLQLHNSSLSELT